MMKSKKQLYEDIMSSVAKEVKKVLNEETAPTGVWVPEYYMKLKDTRSKDHFAPSYLPTVDLLGILGLLKEKAHEVDKEILDTILNRSNEFSREEYVYAIAAAWEIISNLYHLYTKKLDKNEIEYKR